MMNSPTTTPMTPKPKSPQTLQKRPRPRPNPAGLTRQRAAFEHLLAGFRASADRTPAERWSYLEAAHVLAQNRFVLHWRSHWHMLRFARELGHRAEARGQLARLGLTVFGHLVQRLPQGNTGRAHVPALQPMVPPAAVRARISEAMASVAPPANAPATT
ncbi:uncharacterized protein DUF3703 [Melaminivora alkalimesophila]|uniref:Uncharacterized protein DUF3703 n=2 Tax=Melaminivora alkalimesophila TaxID=1165852 RepID=A0A317RBF3_9BURK|nr:uncharacterized protein DUF3703 [Melaminivora alkalimesophila]